MTETVEVLQEKKVEEVAETVEVQTKEDLENGKDEKTTEGGSGEMNLPTRKITKVNDSGYQPVRQDHCFVFLIKRNSKD